MSTDTHANGSTPTSVAFLLQRMGPYHHARLYALAADFSLSVTAIEFRAADPVYAWNSVHDSGGYSRLKTSAREGLKRALEQVRPDVIVCAGYSDPEIHCAASWALASGIPLVTCSDSTYDDEPRTWAKEMLKRIILSAFDAALVAGVRAHDYLESLGMSGAFRFAPWDVVDNGYFGRCADAVRNTPVEARTRLNLPENFFVCAARFVPKKNLDVLIEAFGIYVKGAGDEPWSLVLSGSGPLETELRSRVDAAGLGLLVRFAGFLQYEDLPACYGLAGALVLPSISDQWGLVVNEAMAVGLPVLVSSRCGCTPELVHSGENGFTFEPDDVARLAELMGMIAGSGPERRAAMGASSREIVGAFSPSAFASGLKAAIGCALAKQRRQNRILTRTVVGALSVRPVH